MNRTGGTSALLAKVGRQLKGERGSNLDEDEDDLQAYLSGFSKKTPSKTLNKNWAKSDDESDSSESIEIDAKKDAKKSVVNKYLKKPAPVKDDQSTKKTGLPAKKAPVSSALAKANNVSQKFQTRAPREILRISDSDVDLSISSEIKIGDASELEPADVPPPIPPRSPSPKRTQRPISPRRQVKSPSSPQLSPRRLRMSSDDSSSSLGIGKGGSKFLKKKVEKPATPEEVIPTTPERRRKISDAETLAKLDEFSHRSTENMALQLDTEEESLQEYIMGPGKRSKSPKLVPPKTPRTPRTATMEDIREEEDEDKTVSSDEGGLRLNIMDIDELDAIISRSSQQYSPVPDRKQSRQHSPYHSSAHRSSANQKKDQKSSANQKDDHKSSANQKKDQRSLANQSRDRSQDKQSKEKSSKNNKKHQKHHESSSKRKHKADDFFASHGLQSVDDLLGSGYNSHRDDISEDSRAGSPIRGILSPSPDLWAKTPRSSRSRVHYSVDEVTEIPTALSSLPQPISTARTSVHAYSEDFESVISESSSMIHTDRGSESEPESVQTERSHRTSSPIQTRSRSYRRSETEAYTEDFISDTSRVTTPRGERRARVTRQSSVDSQRSSPTPSTRRYRPSTHNAHVQTSISDWPRMHSYNPLPISAPHIGSDALEVLSDFSPGALALHEMLKQQFELTRNFLLSAKQLRDSLLNNIKPDYQYTTLEDTKKFIKHHRRQRRKKSTEHKR